MAMGRALAHESGRVPGFSDPFALQLLPGDFRAAVERRASRQWPRSGREAVLGAIARRAEDIIGPRTMEIDEGLRALPAGHQLVILGAGLDARAYRMRELSGSVAFEVDHPASQGFKIRQASGLRPCTRELRHVPVDFARERLDDALARAGHVAAAPTAWVFEGVISYLTPRDVASTLDVIAARSAPASRLLATYNEPSRTRRLVSDATGWVGEPQHASYWPDEMRRLLSDRGFVVRSDRDSLERARRWHRAPTSTDRVWIRFHRVIIADFVRTGP
jgi:methyltransferase (TIGR00027 family)